jgi:hypothetical protein
MALALACRPAKPVPKVAAEPKVRATVVTIRTTLTPENRTWTHALMISKNVARSGDEVDVWRLFDVGKKQVTFVDDIAKTYRTESLAALTDQHRKAFAQRADDLPRAQWSATDEKRNVQGVEAMQSLVKMGAYQRQLWIAKHPLIPEELFAMMRASDPAPSPIAGVATAVDDALLAVRGFPMIDRGELPFGNKKLVVDHEVVKIEQKDVPASWFVVPAGYQAYPARNAGSPVTPAGSRPPG